VDYYYTAINPDGSADYYVKRYLEYIKKYNSRPPDYYLSYGYYNFMKFKNAKGNLSELGQNWSKQTAKELQEIMEEGLESSMGEIEATNDGFTSFAYKTHFSAYIEGGLINRLPVTDLITIAKTPDLHHSFGSIEGVSQIVNMAAYLYNNNSQIQSLKFAAYQWRSFPYVK